MRGIKIQEELIKGVIYSQFNEKQGPIAVTWVPTDLKIEIRDLVSLKSINMLVGERGIVPKSLAIVPFASYDLKGMIKLMEIKDVKHRGGVLDSTLTVLFNEANDVIFYKHINQFEELFEDIASDILKLEEKNASTDEIHEQIKKFYTKMVETLNELRDVEISITDTPEFTRETEEISEKREFKFKVILCGDQEVGKTSIVLRYTDKAFRRTYIPTIGVNISEKDHHYDRYIVEFIIWDIAGQSKFQMMRKHFYQGADGKFLVFDLTNPESLDNIIQWNQDIDFYLNKEIKGYLLGNKSDLFDQIKVDKVRILELAKNLNLEYIETSALSGKNIDEAFRKLGELIIREIK